MEALKAAFQIMEPRYNKLLDTYFTYLQDVPLIKVTKAIRKAVLTLDAFPTINKLRTLANAHDTDDDCDICHSNNVHAREQHIQSLAITWYREDCQGDMIWLIERLYAHAKTGYHDHPEIAKWAEQALGISAQCERVEDDMLVRAEQLAKRAPWMLDKVVMLLEEHRDFWLGRVRDMEQYAAGIDETTMHKIGLESISQILRHGEQTYAKINREVTSAVIHQTGKPRLGHWEPQQTAEGKEKLELIRMRFDDVSI